jgi:hypothetical protein
MSPKVKKQAQDNPFYLTFVADCHPFYLLRSTEGEIEGEEASKR